MSDFSLDNFENIQKISDEVMLVEAANVDFSSNLTKAASQKQTGSLTDAEIQNLIRA